MVFADINVGLEGFAARICPVGPGAVSIGDKTI